MVARMVDINMYPDVDGNDLVYGLTDHSHIPMVDCYPISHLFLYIITY